MVAAAKVRRTGPAYPAHPPASEATTTHPRLAIADRRNSLSATPSGRRQAKPVSIALAMALCISTAMLSAGRAEADPASTGPMLDIVSPPPAAVAVPSPPPVTAKSTDGWTLALLANSETQTPAAPLNPAVPSRDFIVGGLFNGTLRAPNGAKTPAPSGTLQVGYQIQCLGGLLAALKPSSVDVPVLKEEFSGADPTATVTAFRVQVDCPGQAFIRSYAILTRTTNADDTVVAYYGANIPV